MLKEFMAHPQSRTGAMAPIAVRHRHGNGPRTPTSPTVEDLLRGNCINSNIIIHHRRKGYRFLFLQGGLNSSVIGNGNNKWLSNCLSAA